MLMLAYWSLTVDISVPIKRQCGEKTYHSISNQSISCLIDRLSGRNHTERYYMLYMRIIVLILID